MIKRCNGRDGGLEWNNNEALFILCRNNLELLEFQLKSLELYAKLDLVRFVDLTGDLKFP